MFGLDKSKSAAWPTGIVLLLFFFAPARQFFQLPGKGPTDVDDAPAPAR